MKKITVYLALAAGVLTGMTACSDSNDDLNGGNTALDGSEHYISVNIQNTESSSAAAPRNAAPQTRANSDDYANGTDAEGKISKVRFYFFNGDGSAYSLTNSTPAGVNFLDYNIDSMTVVNNDPTTVERYTNTVVVIDGATGTAPAYMIAVANPDALTNPSNTATSQTSLLGNGSLNRDQLTARTMQTSTYRIGGNGDFLMTNSVYGDENATYRCATATQGHIKDTRADAITDPVNIYVERLAAKVTVTHPTTNWTTVTVNNQQRDAYNLGYYKYNNDQDSVQVYAVVQGWGLSDEQRYGKVFKDINGYENWNTLLGFSPWNSATNHRSFWEVSPSFNATDNDNPIDYQFSTYSNRFSNDNVAYTMPNTPTAASNDDAENRSTSPTQRTKVLLAVNLMYQDANGWHNAEISTYRGQEYLGESAVKNQILNDVRDHLIKRTADNTWSELTEDDIEFRVPGASSTQKSYEVVPTLKSGVNYAHASLAEANQGNATVISQDSANTVLRTYSNYAEVRKDGMAYYYTAIRHYGTDESKVGVFGVVRNHWYQVNITGLKGWGTPVYDPSQIIQPITPSDELTYLAARINVLQWHIVANDYNIDGSEKH